MKQFSPHKIKTCPKKLTPTKISPHKNSSSQILQYYQQNNKKNILANNFHILLSQLKDTRQKLQACLQLYQLLSKSDLSPRCIEHNNVISLYCINQRKLLCVNCIYGNSRHKIHKVNPSKQCEVEIRKDIQVNESEILSELKKIDIQRRICEQNMNILEMSLREWLMQIEGEYQKRRVEQEDNFKRLKERMIFELNEQIQKNRIANLEYSNIRDMIEMKVSGEQGGSDKHIRKHIVYNRLRDIPHLRMQNMRKQSIELIRKQFIKQFNSIFNNRILLS